MTDMIWWIGIGVAVIAGLVAALIVISFFRRFKFVFAKLGPLPIKKTLLPL